MRLLFIIQEAKKNTPSDMGVPSTDQACGDKNERNGDAEVWRVPGPRKGETLAGKAHTGDRETPAG